MHDTFSKRSATPSSGPLKAVLFDAVGTLIDPDPPVAEAYCRVAGRFGMQASPRQVDERFQRAFARQEELDDAAQGRTSEDRERRRWQAIVAQVFPDAERPRELFDAIYAHFADGGHWRVFDDAPHAWRALRKMGVVLGIASNFDERLLAICRRHEPLASCRQVFISSQVGSRKPRPEFFDEIASSLGLAPAEMLLVGDSRTNDFDGARAAGWNAVLIDRSGKDIPGFAGPVIRSLSELPESVAPAIQARSASE